MVEGTWITGPIKPLIMFAGLARAGGKGRRAVDLSLVTTIRGDGAHVPDNLLLQGAAEAGVHIDVLHEQRAWDINVMTQLCRVIETHHPDIIETHQVKCHFILAQILMWRRVRKSFDWIAYHHGYTRASLKLRCYEMLDRWSLRRPDRVITVCRPFAAELIANGVPAARISVIPNAIEWRPPPSSAEILALRQLLKLSDEDVVFLSVGRLSREKGHADLIVAFKRMLTVTAGSRRMTLLLIGDGPERTPLERLARDAGNNIQFLGHQANVWPYYFSADVFVMPSHSEGSPLVLLEAMAAGRAIVATAVGGVPETVVDGVSALLVAPHDVDGLTQAMASLHGDRVRRARLAKCASEALRNFLPDVYRDRILAVYHELRATSCESDESC
jgi:glycosyltransferase involved in cell wall biosynthesis